MDDGSTALTGVTTPPTTNVGYDVFNGTNIYGSWVRGYTDSSTYFGKVCSAIGASDTSGPVVGWALGAGNGSICTVILEPAMS